MRFQWQESRGCAASARDMLLAQRQVLDDADMVDAKLAFACQQKKRVLCWEQLSQKLQRAISLIGSVRLH